jgi:transcriptional regulator with PAS, ATPase and Fis domain
LFGHEAGAYTDAREAKRGLFELAHKGTIFLDEIGDMPKTMQAKLLQVLETHEFRRVGGTRTIEVDVHVVTATNRNLEEAVAAGEFREDLFYRLNVVPVHLPALRERPEDIMPLALHFRDVLCHDIGVPVREVAPDALAALEGYRWPGNARELRNVLERTLLLDDAEAITLGHLPSPAGVVLDDVERSLIVQALARSDGNKTEAARLLGVSRDTLRYRLEKYAIR